VSGGVAIDEAYLTANEPVVKEQLQKEGGGLGKLLDDSLRPQ
jgi:hypothetical protein